MTLLLALGLFAIPALALVVGFFLWIRKHFGNWGIGFSVLIFIFLLVGSFLGYKFFTTERVSTYCKSDTITSDTITVTVFVFSDDMPIGSKVKSSDYYLANYPRSYVTPFIVTDENFDAVDGQILCIDVYKGQILSTQLIQGCNNK